METVKEQEWIQEERELLLQEVENINDARRTTGKYIKELDDIVHRLRKHRNSMKNCVRSKIGDLTLPTYQFFREKFAEIGFIVNGESVIDRHSYPFAAKTYTTLHDRVFFVFPAAPMVLGLGTSASQPEDDLGPIPIQGSCYGEKQNAGRHVVNQEDIRNAVSSAINRIKSKNRKFLETQHCNIEVGDVITEWGASALLKSGVRIPHPMFVRVRIRPQKITDSYS